MKENMGFSFQINLESNLLVLTFCLRHTLFVRSGWWVGNSWIHNNSPPIRPYKDTLLTTGAYEKDSATLTLGRLLPSSAKPQFNRAE